MNERRPTQPNLLLVEDNPGDVRLTQEALKDAGFAEGLAVAADGLEAMEMLTGAVDTGHPRPDLILLDLNMPRMDGRMLLREMNKNDVLRRIPTIVLTTSSDDEDVLNAYELNANCYITKPVDLAHFTEVVRQIRSFWLDTVTLPPR